MLYTPFSDNVYFTQCTDAAYMLQMLHVAWSVCVLGRRVNCAKRLNRSRCRTSRVDPRNHVLDGRPDPHGKGHYSFRGHMCMPAHRWPTVTYLYTMTSGALRIVRLECAYSANAADECMTRDKTAMRPFAKLLWILVNCRESWPTWMTAEGHNLTDNHVHWTRQFAVTITSRNWSTTDRDSALAGGFKLYTFKIILITTIKSLNKKAISHVGTPAATMRTMTSIQISQFR